MVDRRAVPGAGVADRRGVEANAAGGPGDADSGGVAIPARDERGPIREARGRPAATTVDQVLGASEPQACNAAGSSIARTARAWADAVASARRRWILLPVAAAIHPLERD